MSNVKFLLACLLCPVLWMLPLPEGHADEAPLLRVGTFAVDATPPVGSPLAYQTMEGVDSELSCRGVVIAGAGDPIVLCTVDWIGIGNGGHKEFIRRIAAAVGAPPERVTVHSLHQHDAPRCDFSADELMAQEGLGGQGFNPEHARSVIAAAAEAAKAALEQAEPVNRLATGTAVTDRIASNRRILGPDGKVAKTRPTYTTDPDLHAAPIGTVDPVLRMVAFLHDDRPVAVMTYFATHPQSYYRTKLATVDFPGMARNAREEKLGVRHVHFTGAGGNVGAGKWNRGVHEDRLALASRLEQAMETAWESRATSSLSAEDLSWKSEEVLLPLATNLDEEEMKQRMVNRLSQPFERFGGATALAWMERCRKQDPIAVSSLKLGPVYLLHMPGELFVEYQLAAQAMRPDQMVAMAAYSDYGPGYIGTAVAYEEGGYETGVRVSRVAPGVEEVLTASIRRLLDID